MSGLQANSKEGLRRQIKHLEKQNDEYKNKLIDVLGECTELRTKLVGAKKAIKSLICTAKQLIEIIEDES